ncbi:MAG: TAXI family TRAP transporter solute-binding subunit [Oscillospiraceae bacterium]|nr:TAXI family TRAP transporter solute-binding subunit [Oscillospiraceae bacterium]
MKKIFALILAAAMVLALVACGGGSTSAPATSSTPAESSTSTESSAPAEAAPAASADAVKITLATGGTSGTYYAVGGVLGTVLGPKLTLSELSVESTGASKANVNMITDGEAQMAILQSDVINYAHNGTNTFEGEVEDSALWIAGIYNETVQILAKPGIKNVSDLKGKTVCVGDVGSGTEVNAWQVLGAAGLTKDDIKVVNGSFQDGVDQLKDGKIDAAFTVAGAPTTAIVDYATTNELNLVSLSDTELAAIREQYPFLVQDNLPVGTYTGQTEEIVCVAVQAALVASKDLSEDVVYEITKGMFDNKADLEAGHAKFGFLDAKVASVGTVPLHPGAEKYYKEIGVL